MAPECDRVWHVSKAPHPRLISKIQRVPAISITIQRCQG